VDGLVTCGLTACRPGSAPGPAFGNDYGRALPYIPQVGMGTKSTLILFTLS